MAIPDDKYRLQCTIDEATNKKLERWCKRMDRTKSEVVMMAIDEFDEMAKSMCAVGLTPERMKAVRQVFCSVVRDELPAVLESSS